MFNLWMVPILTYHRVGRSKDDHVPTVSAEAFEAQLRFIQRHGYRVIDLAEVVARLSAHDPIERRSIVITFDDGYEETASAAAPLLHRFGFRATVFVTPAEIGTPGFMTWDQVHQLLQEGFTIGSHTMHHRYLPLESRERIQQELVESKRLLEQRLGRPIDWLSYPVGGFTPAIQAQAKIAGYRAACTTNRAMSKNGCDLFAMRRIKMTDRDRYEISMWVKLSGYYDLFRRLEQPA